jgi:TolA-binding protein
MQSERCWKTRTLGLLVLTVALAAPKAAFSQAADAAADAKVAAARDYRVAYGFQKRKLYPQAAVKWAAFIKAYPTDERIANAHYHLGVGQFQQKQLPPAAATFRTILAKFPKFEHRDGVQFNLGLVQYNTAIASKKPADYKAAAVIFAVLPTQYAKSKYLADGLYYQAECLYLSGDKAAAVPVYRKIVAGYKTSPLLPDVYYALGTAEQELEQFDEASKTFAEFLQKYPALPQANECRLRLGLVQLKRKQYAAADPLLAQVAALKDFPFADFALLQQAQSKLEQEKLADAAALYESLPQKFTKSGYLSAALLAGGKCRYRSDQLAQAQTNFTAVVAAKSPEAAEAAYWLGRTQIRLKKPADAVVTLDAALAAYPQSEFKPQITFARIDAIYEQPARRKETVALYAGFAQANALHELAPDALYRASLAALQLEDYPAAKTHTDAFLKNATFAKHRLTPEVLFIGAESRLLAETPDYVQSDAFYRRLITEHAMHAQVPQAGVRVGFCLYSTKKYDEAVVHLTKLAPTLKQPAQAAETRLLIGRSHSEAKRYPEAAAAFRLALTADPKWDRADEVLFLLAVSLRNQEDIKNAAVELTRLTTQHKESPYLDQAFFQLGEISLEQKQYDVAVTHYRKVATTFPKSELASSALYGSATALFEKGDFPNATAEVVKLLAAFPQSEDAKRGRYLRGMSYRRVKNFPAAVTDLTAFLASKPEEADGLTARFELALSHVGLEQHDLAVTALNAILTAKPDYERADAVYYELGFAYLAGKKPKEAATAFQSLAAKSPESPLVAESWFRVGEFHEQAAAALTGEESATARKTALTEAGKAFTEGLAKVKAPELKERLYYKLGWVQYEQDAFAESAKSFQALVAAFPQGDYAPESVYMSGEGLFRQKNYTAALVDYAKVVVAKTPKFHARALYRSGDCAANLKQWPASQAHYVALVTQFPKDEQLNEAQYGVGFALQNQNKLDEAKVAYQVVVKASPNTDTGVKSRYMLGECAFGQKKFDEAIGFYLEIVEGYKADDPNIKEWHARGMYEMARCFIELKKTDQARESLESLLKLHADHPFAKDAKTLLAKLNTTK